MVAARTRFLTFVATASGFTQAGADATTHATLGVLGARGGLDVVELHVL
jgi:hypothetical protein